MFHVKYLHDVCTDKMRTTKLLHMIFSSMHIGISKWPERICFIHSESIVNPDIWHPLFSTTTNVFILVFGHKFESVWTKLEHMIQISQSDHHTFHDVPLNGWLNGWMKRILYRLLVKQNQSNAKFFWRKLKPDHVKLKPQPPRFMYLPCSFQDPLTQRQIMTHYSLQ